MNPISQAMTAALLEIDQLRTERDAMKADADRYRWLRSNVQPEYSRKSPDSGFVDYNMKWQIKPYLVAVTAVGNDVTFDVAIDWQLQAALEGKP